MAEQFCTSCGKTGKPKLVTQGGCLIELVLWLFLIVPGIIYSLWRLTSKKKVCPYCGNPTMIPLEAPAAKKMLVEHPDSATEIQLPTKIEDISLENETKKCPVCAESIKLEAQKCRFCGEEFDPDVVEDLIKTRIAEITKEIEFAKLKNEGKKQCPQCGKWDFHQAVLRDGTTGDYCHNCGKAFRDMDAT